VVRIDIGCNLEDKLAQRKTTIDEAYAGDIIGLPDNGTFKIGDTLTEGSRGGRADKVHCAQTYRNKSYRKQHMNGGSDRYWAYAGDIIGLPDNGTFKIGDTLTEGEILHFRGLPSFLSGKPIISPA